MSARISAIRLAAAFGSGIILASLGWQGWGAYHATRLKPPLEVRQTVSPLNNAARFLPGTGMGLTDPMGRLMLPKPITASPGIVDPSPVQGWEGEAPIPGDIRELPPDFQVTELPLNDPADQSDSPPSDQAPVDDPPIPGPVEDPPVSDQVPSDPLVP
ncbi:MAG: hypothetical protein PHD43_02520 [Methylococcales bacterium]|nr:hypothetical protein [Methylococcales bacterium]